MKCATMLFQRSTASREGFKAASKKLLVLLFVGLFLPFAQAAKLTADDVGKLVSAGLGEDVLIELLAASEFDFVLSNETRNRLVALGASERVIVTIETETLGSSDARVKRRDVVRDAVLPAKLMELEVGRSYFTRLNLKHERGVHVNTNYWRGTMLPINSEVTLTRLGRDEFDLDTSQGMITVVRRKKVPEASAEDIALNYLSEVPVPLEQLGKKLQRHVARGELVRGMTKEQVLMARGYPPEHRTPSLDETNWVYWNSRFVYQTLVFRDDLLVDGRGVY